MRAYTLSVLTQLANSGNPMVEREIIDWVNTKLSSAGKTTSIRSFQDSSIKDARVIIDLVDAIKPGIINYEVVKDTQTEEVSFSPSPFSPQPGCFDDCLFLASARNKQS
jgi:plastin-3